MEKNHRFILAILNDLCNADHKRKGNYIGDNQRLGAFCYLLDKYSYLHIGKSATNTKYTIVDGMPYSEDIHDVLKGNIELTGSIYPYWMSGSSSEWVRKVIVELHKYYCNIDIKELVAGFPEIKDKTGEITIKAMLNNKGIEELVSKKQVKLAKDVYNKGDMW